MEFIDGFKWIPALCGFAIGSFILGPLLFTMTLNRQINNFIWCVGILGVLKLIAKVLK